MLNFLLCVILIPIAGLAGLVTLLMLAGLGKAITSKKNKEE